MPEAAPTEVRPEWFTCVPARDDLGLLHRLFRHAWLTELTNLIEVCEANLALDLADLRAKVRALRAAPRLSPAVFFIVHRLRRGIAAGDVTEVFDALFFLRRAPREELTARPGMEVTSILTEAWEYGFVEEMRAYRPVLAGGEPVYPYDTLVRPILSHPLEGHRAAIAEAHAQIRAADPVVAAEHDEFVTHTKLFDGVVLRGMTATHAFGAIFLRIPPRDDDAVTYWIEHLVHEISHLKLELLAQHGRLVLNPPEERYPPPIRKDPRPMAGIVHATFVLARMVRVFRALVALGHGPAHAARLDALTAQFEQGLGTLRAHARWTEHGRGIADTLEPCARGLAVPA
ncbi:MAG: hypothetical protein QOI11_59 [Candidatus Eremiobacteraeota bacterium]|nr:hypothetical protein [Candidatus Eremiobacteraeota bacterium]